MKLILLFISVCTRFGDMSVTPLSIQFATGNESAAATQMSRIAGISGGIGASAALLIVCVNPAFIAWWMLDKVSWAWHANVAGAVWVAIVAVTQCMYGYAVVCRQMRLLRWALLSECLLYVVLAYVCRSWAGSACLLWAKPLATLLIGTSVAWQLKRHTLFNATCLLPSLLRQACFLALLIPPCVYFNRWLATADLNPFYAFVGAGIFSCFVMLVALPLMFTREMRADLYRIIRGLMGKLQHLKSEPTSATT
jgi:hypothetical protein